jgi:hypothetical protein
MGWKAGLIIALRVPFLGILWFIFTSAGALAIAIAAFVAAAATTLAAAGAAISAGEVVASLAASLFELEVWFRHCPLPLGVHHGRIGAGHWYYRLW